MTERYDLVVVGGGPAGATVARFASLGGLRVLIVDKKSELGTPQQCSGAVSANALNEADVVPDPWFVAEPIHGFITYDNEGATTTLDYRTYGRDEPLGFVVDRKRFDRSLCGLATDAGAEIWMKTLVTGFTATGSSVTVHLERFGQPSQVEAKVLVGADGLMSQIGLMAGLAVAIPLGDLASCLQYIVEGVPTSGLLEIITGFDHAPGGYAWVFPKGAGQAEVGLGVTKTMTDKDARWHLDKFMAGSFLGDRLANARILEVQGGGVPLASALRRMVADNVLLVGDAARQVNPITGGGIHTALRAGRIAGEFLAEVVPADTTFEADVLRGYQTLWHDKLGHLHSELYSTKSDVFKESDHAVHNQRLYETMASYFSPDSRYRKI